MKGCRCCRRSSHSRPGSMRTRPRGSPAHVCSSLHGGCHQGCVCPALLLPSEGAASEFGRVPVWGRTLLDPDGISSVPWGPYGCFCPSWGPSSEGLESAGAVEEPSWPGVRPVPRRACPSSAGFLLTQPVHLSLAMLQVARPSQYGSYPCRGAALHLFPRLPCSSFERTLLSENICPKLKDRIRLAGPKAYARGDEQRSVPVLWVSS